MRSGKKLMAVLLVFAMMVTVIPESIFAQTSVPEETFITMTAEQILHHTTTEKEYYAIFSADKRLVRSVYDGR